MRIQFCSDLHFNNPDNIAFFGDQGLEKKADILILAGDITFLEYLDRPFEREFFNRLSADYDKVFYLLGNSEFYGGFDTSSLDQPFLEYLRPNIVMLNNQAVDISGHRLVFSTMWSGISLANEEAVLKGSHDFNYFRYKGGRISRKIYNRWHNEAVSFISAEIERSRTGKLVIVTHHMPSMRCSSDRWQGSPLNDVFVAAQDDLVESSGAEYWLYGHSHENQESFAIGQTTLLTNQLAENFSDNPIPFKRDCTFEL